MAPIEAAFQERWPDVARMNLFDDALALDLEREDRLTEQLTVRIRRLAEYCIAGGADAVLFTCSAFGAAIEEFAATAPIPVLKPNEAMFEQALTHGARIGMLATFLPAVASMEAEFHAEARRKGVKATIETRCVPEAMAAAKAGDYLLHNRLLAEAAVHFKGFDVLMLAQFSMSGALGDVRENLPVPVLASPHAAVEKLKTILSGTGNKRP
ncbi:arylsulfatase [Betaproteobacteria bacterium]|nr:arylsulfatase [Betaproteobacteria bacterium]